MAGIIQGIFETVLKNSRNITDLYHDDPALRRELSDDASAFESLLERMRQLMSANGGIKRINTISKAIIAQVEADHAAGQIAAVDGTNAILPTELMSKTVYAPGIISTTTHTLYDPHIFISGSHRKIPELEKEEDLLGFLDGIEPWAAEDNLWMATYREYLERQEALRLINEYDMKLVLIDGPLYTRNLLTQSVVWNDILDHMQKHFDRFIGYIKNLHHSKIMHLAGMALQTDEYWTFHKWRNVLIGRRANDASQRAWVDKALRSDWVRTVYRKNQKAFAFECHPSLVDTGIALIASPLTCAAIVNHEIPFLLHRADEIVRARIDGAAKTENLINGPYYANLANERVFRE